MTTELQLVIIAQKGKDREPLGPEPTALIAELDKFLAERGFKFSLCSVSERPEKTLEA